METKGDCFCCLPFTYLRVEGFPGGSVKNPPAMQETQVPPAMQETQVRSVGQEDLPEKASPGWGVGSPRGLPGGRGRALTEHRLKSISELSN